MLLVPVLVLTIQPSFKTEVSQKLIHDIAHMLTAAAKEDTTESEVKCINLNCCFCLLHYFTGDCHVAMS